MVDRSLIELNSAYAKKKHSFEYFHIWYEFHQINIHFSCNDENEHMNHSASTTHTQQNNRKKTV